MKKSFIKLIPLIFTIFILFTTGCNEKIILNNVKLIAENEAYIIYQNTIKNFVPELMAEPLECDVEIKTRDEVTFLSETFVRNTVVKIKSQNVDGKLQYYLLNEFEEANKLNFYCIKDNKFYSLTSNLNEKGTLKEWDYSYVSSFLFPYLNTPLFGTDAIKYFAAEEKNSNIEIHFILDGSKMNPNYVQRVMKEINPSSDNNLDDVEIILTIDENNEPKAMQAKISMSIFKNNKLHAKKTLNIDYTFNDNINFELNDIILKYASDFSSFN